MNTKQLQRTVTDRDELFMLTIHNFNIDRVYECVKADPCNLHRWGCNSESVLASATCAKKHVSEYTASQRR